jgi:hypothetical protein
LVACFLAHEAACATTSSPSQVETIKNRAVRLVLDGTSTFTTAATWGGQAIAAFLFAAGLQAAVKVGTGSAEFGTAIMAFIHGAVHMCWVWAVIALALLCAGAQVYETLKQSTLYSNQVVDEHQRVKAFTTTKTDEWTKASANVETNPHMFSNGVDVHRFLRSRNAELDEVKAEYTRLMKMMAWNIETHTKRTLWLQMTCWSMCFRNVLDCVVTPVEGSTCHVSDESMNLAREHLSGPVDKLETRYQLLETALNRVSEKLRVSATTGEQVVITQLQNQMTNGRAPLSTTLPTPGNADVATGMALYYILPIVALLVVVASCALARRIRSMYKVGRYHRDVQWLLHLERKARAHCKAKAQSRWCEPLVFIVLSMLQYQSGRFDVMPALFMNSGICAVVHWCKGNPPGPPLNARIAFNPSLSVAEQAELFVRSRT